MYGSVGKRDRRGMRLSTSIDVDVDIDLREILEDLSKGERDEALEILGQDDPDKETILLAYNALMRGRPNEAIAFLERYLAPVYRGKIKFKAEAASDRPLAPRGN